MQHIAAWRAKWWIILLALLATGVAAFIASRQPATYEATALVEVGRVWNQPLKDLFITAETASSPGFIHELAGKIPFYQERLMVQPGLTGWAQVNYPYGASLEDARRKLEYDLYYMKHMSLFLDIFTLLDTVRIILRGGLSEAHKKKLPHYEAAAKKELELAAISEAKSSPVAQ